MRVSIQSLGFAYPGVASARPVLSDFDLDVESGSVHAVVGPNGCGKSTLLRLIARREEPTSGSIRFIGPRHHENLTALVFQDPRLLPWWTAERNVGIGVEFKDVPRVLYGKVRDYHMRLMRLERVRGRRPDELSMGQQTLAGMGRGIAHDAEVLLLDEPFAHLDAMTRRHLHVEFETHWKLDPRTIVIVTHDVEEAVLLSDRISVMRAGPGPLVETIVVDAERPRVGMSPAHPGLRAATAWVWDALERGL